MTFLEKILDDKRREVEIHRSRRPLNALQEEPLYHEPRRSLRGALERSGFGILAEVKKASPSRGQLRREFDPVWIAQRYADCGACGISVLTDEPYFQGSLSHLTLIRNTVALPLLRKDFILDSYQLYEARAAGGDAILLIAAALAPSHLEDLALEAVSLGLEVLVEIHTQEELRIALATRATIFGVNNRDLRTFKTDVALSHSLAALFPPTAVRISESGIATAEDIASLKAVGYQGALIGESLVRSPDPGAALTTLLTERKPA
jgi:indole-3-glycerol phosphate synthase